MSVQLFLLLSFICISALPLTSSPTRYVIDVKKPNQNKNLGVHLAYCNAKEMDVTQLVASNGVLLQAAQSILWLFLVFLAVLRYKLYLCKDL